MKQLNEARNFALKKGGKCLSKRYVNNRTPLQWSCKKMHNWKAIWSNVKRGSWCPECASQLNGQNNRKHSIKECKQFASKKRGKCLSDTYKNTATKLIWQCSNEHQWKATYGNVKAGKWCKKCATIRNSSKTRGSLNDAQELAIKKGGKCISTSYQNAILPLKWECEKGHAWEAPLTKIKHASQWCPYCAGKRQDLESLNALAKQNAGKCLSNKFQGMSAKYRWECAVGHKWEAAAYSIKAGNWCPDCHGSFGEAATRAIFESLTGKAFPRSKPVWLINKKGNRMELDGYNRNLQVAFEHQGRQHFIEHKFFGKRTKLKGRKANDDLKVHLCKKQRVHLLIVDEIGHFQTLENAFELIRGFLTKHSIKIVKNATLSSIDLSKARIDPNFQRLRELALSKGGLLLTDTYLGSAYKYKWQCAKGHIWNTSGNKIMSAQWCDKCSRAEKLQRERNNAFKRLENFVKKRGGKILSGQYKSRDSTLKFKCKKGHTWQTKAAVIVVGSWCPKCALISLGQLTVERAKSRIAATLRRGVRLKVYNRSPNPKYIDMIVRCTCGGRTKIKRHNIRRNGKCSKCGKRLLKKK